MLVVVLLRNGLNGGPKSLSPVFIVFGGLLVGGIVDRLATRALLSIERRYWPFLGLIGVILAIVFFAVAWRLAGSTQA